ncbi:pentraxin-related protein PTX3-like [Stigmatopora argus]
MISTVALNNITILPPPPPHDLPPVEFIRLPPRAHSEHFLQRRAIARCSLDNLLNPKEMGAPRVWGVLRIWGVLCMMGYASTSPLLGQVDYADVYDNEVSREQHEADSQTSCQAAELSRWDKLFMALENSHMRQNMLLDSSESCREAATALQAQMEHLARTASRQCPPWQAVLKTLQDLREEGEARERRFNASLQTLTRSKAELEVSQEATYAPADGADKALGSMAGELQRLHAQLGRVMQQVGVLRKDRGNS